MFLFVLSLERALHVSGWVGWGGGGHGTWQTGQDFFKRIAAYKSVYEVLIYFVYPTFSERIPYKEYQYVSFVHLAFL